VQTAVGVLPARDELNLDGLDEQTLADLDAVLTIDVPRWQQEMGDREGVPRPSSTQFEGLPEEIWEAHRRVAPALHEAAD
jgi:phosphoenolpyruvate carboxykinase (GTP)